MTNAVTIAQGGSSVATSNYVNRLINGSFDVWQRGTSFATGSGYTADRWKIGYQDDGAVYTRQASDLTGFNYYMRMIKGGTANGSHMVQQAIETQNTPDMVGQWVTFSCWARLSNTTTQATHQLTMALGFSAATDYSGWLNSADICSYYARWRATGATGVTFQAGSTTVSPSTPIQNSLTLTTSWQRFYYTLFVPSNTKTIVCGVYSEATLQNGGIDVVGMQFELGTSPSAFNRRDIQQELAMCQRYYEKSYDLSTAPGGLTFGGSISTFPAAYAVYFPIQYKVMKRVTPTTLTFYSPMNGATGVYNFNNTTNVALSGTLSQGQYGCCPYTGATPGNVSAYVHFTADAEI